MSATTAVKFELDHNLEIGLLEAADHLAAAFPEALNDRGPAASVVYYLSQVSPHTLLAMAAVVYTAPDAAWIEPQEQAEARALCEALACTLAGMGQN